MGIIPLLEDLALNGTCRSPIGNEFGDYGEGS
jgi:hypothetical protein